MVNPIEFSIHLESSWALLTTNFFTKCMRDAFQVDGDFQDMDELIDTEDIMLKVDSCVPPTLSKM